MSESAIDITPDIQSLITEDETPVDNLPSEKQQRLLTEPLYSSWAGPGASRTFLAAANVGVFAQVRHPAIVPDMFLSLDVEVAEDWWRKEHRSYFVWEFGKPPDLVLEIVSNTEGGEADDKRHKYARMRPSYYVIYDPLRQVMPDVLTVYRLHGSVYERQETSQFPDLKLGLTLWDGTFEGKRATWLRWTDEHGGLIPTGKERAEQAEHQLLQERQRAEQVADQLLEERQRAEQEHQRAERLAALLRQAGIDPEQV
jgi:Uma2 family endonuclease